MSHRKLPHATADLGRCEAMQCDEGRAVGICPGCGMALCAACLARHAHYGGWRRDQSEQKGGGDGQQR